MNQDQIDAAIAAATQRQNDIHTRLNTVTVDLQQARKGARAPRALAHAAGSTVRNTWGVFRLVMRA